VTVTWRVVSSDGHPVSGQYAFTVTGSASGTATAPAVPAASPTPSESVPATADEGIPTFVWAILGIILVAVLGGLVAVLLRRSRPTPED